MLADQLSRKIYNVMAKSIDKSKNYAIVDFPNSPNVGDSALWLGTIIFLESYFNKKPKYVACLNSFDLKKFKKSLPKGSIVFINGGGNWGDLWKHHHEFREEIISNLVDYSIVQLPQSIHFDNIENLKKSIPIVNSHPDFTLLVRDENSFSFAKKYYKCKVKLCPDMALNLNLTTMKKLNKPNYDVLYLMRSDCERAIETLSSPSNYNALFSDWLFESKIDSLLMKLLTKISNKGIFRYSIYNLIAKIRLKRGVALLNCADVVVSDRLHAHILCLILCKKHIWIDNSYGKLSMFSECWSTSNAVAIRAESCEQVSKLLGSN